jgi:hypothetical protein
MSDNSSSILIPIFDYPFNFSIVTIKSSNSDCAVTLIPFAALNISAFQYPLFWYGVYFPLILLELPFKKTKTSVTNCRLLSDNFPHDPVPIA